MANSTLTGVHMVAVLQRLMHMRRQLTHLELEDQSWRRRRRVQLKAIDRELSGLAILPSLLACKMKSHCIRTPRAAVAGLGLITRRELEPIELKSKFNVFG